MLFNHTAGSYVIDNGTGTNVLTLGASGIMTATGSPVVVINADVALGTSQTWAINGTGLTMNGIVSGTGSGLTKTGAGALTLSATNTYNGATALFGGTTTLSGANGSIAASSGLSFSGGGRLVLDNAATANNDRIANNVTLGFLSELHLIGNGPTSSVTETFGTLTAGGGQGVVTVTGNGAAQLQTLAAGALTRSNAGTLYVRGTSLGSGSATNVTRVTIADLTGVPQVGTNTASGGPGSVKDLRIIPYVFADTGGSSNGSASTGGPATYDTLTGLRPLGPNEKVSLSATYTSAVNPENVLVPTGGVVLDNDITVNSITSGNVPLNSTAVAVRTITVVSGVLYYNGNSSIGGINPTNLVLQNGEGVIFNGIGTMAIGAQITITGSGSGGLTKAGVAAVSLGSTAQTYTGPTVINAGTLSILSIGNGGVSSPIGASTSAAANLVFNGGELLFGSSSGTHTTDRLFTVGATTATISNSSASPRNIDFQNTGSIAFIGSGSRSIVFNGSGGGGGLIKFSPLISDGPGGATAVSVLGTFSAELLNAANDYTGVTTLGGSTSTRTLTAQSIANGEVASSIGASSSAASNLLIGAGRVFAVTDAGSTNRLFTLNGTLDGHTGTVRGAGLNYTNTGSLAYGIVNQTRTLQLQGGSTGNPSSFAPLIADNGSGATSLTVGNGVTTVWGVTNANTYTGVTSISGSTVGAPATLIVSSLAYGGVASNIGASTSAAANLVLIANGNSTDLPTLRYTGGTASTDRLFTISSTKNGNTVAIDSSGTGTLSFTNTGAIAHVGVPADQTRTLTLTGTNTGDNTFAPQLTNFGAGVVSLTKGGVGTWRLTSTTSNYTGVTTIGSTTVAGGVLAVDVLANGGSASGIGAATSAATNLIINIGTLRYTGGTISTDRLVSFGVSGSSVLEASGTGPVNFNNAGNVGYGAPGQGRIVTLGGTNTGANTIASLFTNNTSGTVGITKTGVGTWNLSGNNTYTNVTTVSGGTLNVNGVHTPSAANTGAYSVAGGTLGGTGTLAGGGTQVVAVTATGTLAPGNSTIPVGNLTSTKTVNFASGAKFAVQLGAFDTPNNADRLTLSGAGTAVNFLTGNVLVLSPDTAFNLVGNEGPKAYVIASVDAGTGDANIRVDAAGSQGLISTYTYGATPTQSPSDPITIDVSALPAYGDGSTFTLSRVGDDLVLTANTVPVPELTTILGVAAAGLGLAGWIRRRAAKM